MDRPAPDLTLPDPPLGADRMALPGSVPHIKGSGAGREPG
jgi:hypothetical protein